MTEFEPTDWQARLQTAVAETLKRRQAERQARAQRKAARDWGLAQRHQRKAAHNRIHPTPSVRSSNPEIPRSITVVDPEILDNPAWEVPNGPRES